MTASCKIVLRAASGGLKAWECFVKLGGVVGVEAAWVGVNDWSREKVRCERDDEILLEWHDGMETLFLLVMKRRVKHVEIPKPSFSGCQINFRRFNQKRALRALRGKFYALDGRSNSKRQVTRGKWQNPYPHTVSKRYGVARYATYISQT